MDQELQKLIRQLQQEKCPPTVLNRVAQRISREKLPKRAVGTFFARAVSIACLLAAIPVWQWQVRRGARLATAEMAAAQARADRAVVLQQTQEALGYIGQALVRAAAHTENALLREAVPPLRNSFEIAKSKITKPI
jgi:hypothetical protein